MLDLSLIRIDGGTQSRVKLDAATVAEYAEAFAAGAEFPAVTVFFDGSDRWLADGFHRYFGAKKAGKKQILEHIIPGTQREAVLYSIKANGTHGLKRTNADKRKSVETLVKDEEWGTWSDRKIAEAAGVSVTFVSALRRPEVKEQRDKNRKTSAEKAAGCSPATPPAVEDDDAEAAAIAKLPKEEQAAAIHKPTPKAAPEAPPAPANHELEEAVSTINELAAENDQLRDRVAVAAMSGTDEERAMAAETIAELRDQINTLEAELDAVRTSRDTFQRQNAELMKQVRLQQKQIKKLGG